MAVVSLVAHAVILPDDDDDDDGYVQYKVWVKPNSEMSFLYGNNVLKSGLGRMTEGIPQYAGVVVYSMSDVPLGEHRRSPLNSRRDGQLMDDGD